MSDKAKILMNRAMHYMMLSCDNATFLMIKKDYQKLKCKENLQLNMHLMGCKFCRAFNKQNAIISEHLEKLKDIPPAFKLSDEKKIEIEKALTNS